MPEFVRMESGGAQLLLDRAETELVRRLTGELRAVLTGRKHKEDPVLDRLFPKAYEDDEDESAYRDLIGDDLLKQKLATLDAISTSLGRRESAIEIKGEALHAWLACLTDLRLAIGTRLDVDEQRMSAEIDPKDPDARSLTILHWLGWVQEGLLQTAGGL